MPATETRNQSFMASRNKRRGSAVYVPFSQTAAGLDASFSKESPEVRQALLRQNSGLSWGAPPPPPGPGGSQSVLSAADGSTRSAMHVSPVRKEESKRSGSLKRQGEAGRSSKGSQWSTSTHSVAGSDAMAQPGLLQQVVSWGRTDIVRQVLIELHTVCTACALHVHTVCTACALHVHCMCMCTAWIHLSTPCMHPLQVLIEPQLSAERTERKMRAALQEALERGLPEIVDTLLDHADDRTSAENTYSPRTQFDGEALARYPHTHTRTHTHRHACTHAHHSHTHTTHTHYLTSLEGGSTSTRCTPHRPRASATTRTLTLTLP